MRKVVLLQRLRDHAVRGGRTMRFYVRPGSRSRAWIWLRREDVPDFEGETAWAAVERVGGRWRVVKLVAGPLSLFDDPDPR
jgi:hypothetical protein